MYSALLGLIFLAGVTDTAAQVDESPIRIFGYFQTQFNQYDGNPQQEGATNTFLLQQLNIFLQKDLSKDFAALVDMEVLNTFSTSEATGALNMEEAWVRYRAGRGFNIKVGLQIPIFNHLNTIKNQTPVLPYVTRPFIYEESFDQLASLDEFVPARAFAQAFGTLPAGPLRLDYALFVGNSPNVRSNDDLGQSGVDTTNTVMPGGRVGLRVQALKVEGVHARGGRARPNGWAISHAFGRDCGRIRVPVAGPVPNPRARPSAPSEFALRRGHLPTFVIIEDGETRSVSIDKDQITLGTMNQIAA